jgi:hypothetical protein
MNNTKVSKGFLNLNQAQIKLINNNPNGAQTSVKNNENNETQRQESKPLLASDYIK